MYDLEAVRVREVEGHSEGVLVFDSNSGSPSAEETEHWMARNQRIIEHVARQAEENGLADTLRQKQGTSNQTLKRAQSPRPQLVVKTKAYFDAISTAKATLVSDKVDLLHRTEARPVSIVAEEERAAADLARQERADRIAHTRAIERQQLAEARARREALQEAAGIPLERTQFAASPAPLPPRKVVDEMEEYEAEDARQEDEVTEALLELEAFDAIHRGTLKHEKHKRRAEKEMIRTQRQQELAKVQGSPTSSMTSTPEE
eukprot:TRINITY_DN40244_c0_g1_i1.p1 TRINITY_DN40244_c0_g1~~TRINITY_DN40244_c0_g1_i1.p1  ORF type:complete len:260 (-),score=34.82 TRINITY_DN40244_c0_g1_i1:3-782(-)